MSLATSTLGSPLPQLDSLNTNQTWSAWAQDQQAELTQTLREGQDQVVQGWQWLQEFLPRKVSLYVEGTAEDGQTLLEDLYEETRKSIVEKTSGNVDDITGLVETFIEKLENIRVSAVDIGQYIRLNFSLPTASLNPQIPSMGSHNLSQESQTQKNTM